MKLLINDKDTYRVMKLFISSIIINNNLAKKLFRYQKHFLSYLFVACSENTIIVIFRPHYFQQALQINVSLYGIPNVPEYVKRPKLCENINKLAALEFCERIELLNSFFFRYERTEASRRGEC